MHSWTKYKPYKKPITILIIGIVLLSITELVARFKMNSDLFLVLLMGMIIYFWISVTRIYFVEKKKKKGSD
jgi:uncharacterized membrane protein